MSGVILGLSSSQVADLAFVRKKGRRLLVPFLVVTVILVAGRGAFRDDGGVLNIAYSWIFPYSHMWFLPAMFLLFVAAAALSALVNVRDVSGAVSLLAAALFFHFLPLPADLPFAISKAAGLAPFFAAGVLLASLSTFTYVDYNKPLSLIGIAALAIVMVVVDQTRAVELMISFAAVILVFWCFPDLLPLRWVGRYSMTIYLLHSIFISLGMRVSVGAPAIEFLATAFAALLLPIAVERLMRGWAPMALPLIGQSRKGQRSLFSANS